MSKTTQLFHYVIMIIIISFSININPTTRPNSLTQNGLLNCTGTITAKTLETNQVNDLYLDKAQLKSFKISSITSAKSSFTTLRTPLIIAHNKDKILYINSLIKVKGKLLYKQNDDSQPEVQQNPSSSTHNSFVQLNSITINHIPQWKQILDDTSINFNDINIKLNQQLISDLLNKDSISINTTTYESEKDITIPSLGDDMNTIKHVLIEMTFHFNSLLWNNQQAYIKIGNDFYWIDNHQWKNDSNVNKEDCLLGNKWQNQIKMIIPKRFIIDNIIRVKFGVILNSYKNELRSLLTKCNLTISHVQDKEIISFDNLLLSIK